MEIESIHQFAGFWKRTMAIIIDSFVLIIAHALLILLGGLMIKGILGLAGADKALAKLVYIYAIMIGSILSLWATWLYFALMESSTSQATLGKMALGIKVIDIDGDRVTFEKCTARYFLKIISYLPFFIGFFMAGFSSRKQALHDIITQCMVVDKYWS